MNHEDGRIRLTWPQIVWGITVLVLMAGKISLDEYRLGKEEAQQMTTQESLLRLTTSVQKLEFTVAQLQGAVDQIDARVTRRR